MNEQKHEDVMKAVEELRKHGLNNGGALGYHAGWCDEVADLLENLLTLLREKDAEIERLTAENGILKKRLDEAETNIELLEDVVGDVSDDEVEQLEKLLAMERADAITEFAERLKTHECLPEYPWDEPFVLTSNIDQIAKEMKGEHEDGC